MYIAFISAICSDDSCRGASRARQCSGADLLFVLAPDIPCGDWAMYSVGKSAEELGMQQVRRADSIPAIVNSSAESDVCVLADGANAMTSRTGPKGSCSYLVRRFTQGRLGAHLICEGCCGEYLHQAENAVRVLLGGDIWSQHLLMSLCHLYNGVWQHLE